MLSDEFLIGFFRATNGKRFVILRSFIMFKAVEINKKSLSLICGKAIEANHCEKLIYWVPPFPSKSVARNFVMEKKRSVNNKSKELVFIYWRFFMIYFSSLDVDGFGSKSVSFFTIKRSLFLEIGSKASSEKKEIFWSVHAGLEIQNSSRVLLVINKQHL